MNTALRVLLKGREEDKQTHEEKILANINELVLPYLNRLKGTRLDERQRASIAIIEANLKDIIAPFGAKAAARNLSLTPSEIQIANLIKHGMTAKEIAGITSLSPRTIECHRASIRKKLGIKNRKVNLRVFLLSSY
jgi:DNA-binding CsgD family transcriptional regulator